MNRRRLIFIIALLTMGFGLLFVLQFRSTMDLIRLDNSIKRDNIDKLMIKAIDGFNKDRSGWLSKLNDGQQYGPELKDNVYREIDSIIDDAFSIVNLQTKVEYAIGCKAGSLILFQRHPGEYTDELKESEFRYPLTGFGNIYTYEMEIAVYIPSRPVAFLGKGKDIWNSDIRDGFVVQIILMFLYLVLFVIVAIQWVRYYYWEKESKLYIERVSHEYNTPVATISLATEMLQDKDVVTNEEVQTIYLKTIATEAKFLKSLTDQVLMAGSIDRNLLFTPMEDIDVHQYIDFCVKARKLIVDDRKGTIDVDLKAVNHIVRANTMLGTIFSNLLDNAIKYSDGAPQISVKTTDYGSRKIRIIISDKGLGMSEKEVRHAFKKYYRGSHANIKGFGLGLYSTYQIVKHFRGSIRIMSEVGKGTTVIVTLNCK